MYNYFMLMGFVTKEVEVKEVKDGLKVAKVTLAVKRDFKNQDGEYDVDFITVTLWDYVTDIALECVKKGMRLGVKGRIIQKSETIASGAVIQAVELRAEKLIFLENKPQEKEAE